MKLTNFFLAALVVVTIVGCSDLGAGDPNGDDDQFGSGESYWGLVLPDESFISGSSVQMTSDTTLVLTGSTPAGWTVTFTTADPITASTHYRSSTPAALVGGTIRNPANVECSVAAGAANGDEVWLNVGDTLTPTPNGQAGFVVDCFDFNVPDPAYAFLFGTM